MRLVWNLREGINAMDELYSSPWRFLPATTTEEGVELPRGVIDRPDLPEGPFVQVDDQTIAAREGDRIRLSKDGGASWDEGTRYVTGDCDPSPEGAIGAADGAVVFGFADRNQKSRPDWDELLWGTTPADLPCCVSRSADGGKSWDPSQTLHTEWTGAVRDMIRLRTGRLVMTSMKILYQPLRHGCMTYWSDDGGVTWQGSNVIDFGGMGNHDGAMEPSVVELGDGSLYMLIRTNWRQFWYAMSWDGGAHWHPMGPMGIDASTAPGIMLRLRSGRIAMVWNRLHPASGPSPEWRIGGDMFWSAVVSNNFRHELSISFSEDDCKTWSPPCVMARKPEGALSYPYLFEPRPGVLWVSTQVGVGGGARFELQEEAFV